MMRDKFRIAVELDSSEWLCDCEEYLEHKVLYYKVTITAPVLYSPLDRLHFPLVMRYDKTDAAYYFELEPEHYPPVLEQIEEELSDSLYSRNF
ncbi:MAG: hypothetical protein H7257_06595 [Taibaiella sp.]|nr:hypothetical protein [Taibaiella sp.]